MDELSIALKAREFIAKAGAPPIPVSVDAYVQQIGGKVKSKVLGAEEDAWSFQKNNGEWHICVNCGHHRRRQRFSVCHEVAHIALGISADHSAPSWSYAKRPPGEIACDVFAAELLLPYRQFKPRVDACDVGFGAIDTLADEFDASTVATGSRFATFSRDLCAFIISESGTVRYCARSAPLRNVNGWIRPGSPMPSASYAARVRKGEAPSGPEEADPDMWFENWERDGTLYEDTRHLDQWDQTLTLLWFGEDELPPPPPDRKKWEEETYGLRELDGNLPWPGKHRRK